MLGALASTALLRLHLPPTAEALGPARDLGVPTGATMTVTSRNIAEVLPLGRALAELGVRQLKLHHLRPIGNAADHPELLVTSPSAYGRLRDELAAADLPLEVIVDEDLSEDGSPQVCAPSDGPSYFARCLTTHRAMGARLGITLPSWLPTPATYHLVCDEGERQRRLAGRNKPVSRWDSLIETVTDRVTDAYASFPMQRVDTTRRSPDEVL